MLSRSTLKMIPKAFLTVLFVVVVFVRFSASFESSDDIKFASKPLTEENYRKVFDNYEFVFVKFFVDW